METHCEQKFTKERIKKSTQNYIFCLLVFDTYVFELKKKSDFTFSIYFTNVENTHFFKQETDMKFIITGINLL